MLIVLLLRGLAAPCGWRVFAGLTTKVAALKAWKAIRTEMLRLMRDIGTFFGVGENSRASGCSGSFMLSQTADYVAEHGWKTENISISIIGNSPRISAHRDEAAEAMSKAAKTAVTITATTTDTMGFTGRSEGVAAYAVALLSRGERAEKEEK